MIPFGLSNDDKSPNPILPIQTAMNPLPGIQVPVMIGYNSHEALVNLQRKVFTCIINIHLLFIIKL